MAQETVNVVYTADTEKYQQSLSEAMMATDRYAQVIDNAAGSIAKLGMTMTKSFTNMATSVLPDTAKAMGPAVQVAASYEQQLSTLSAKAKVAGDSMNELGRSVRSMSRDFPISIGASIQQFEALQRAGLQGKELASIAEEMVSLGAATGEMSVHLTESMTQFARTFDQLDTTGVDNLTDSVTTMSSSFGASATSILNFSNAVAPLAKQLGMSSTDVVGFATAFAKAGEDGMRAAGVFNTMLADMEKAVRTGAPQIQHYAEAVGMTVTEFTNLAAADPAEAMIQFFEAIESGGDDAIRILEQLGFDGVRAMKSITAVAESGDMRMMVEEAQKAYGSGSTEQGATEAFNGLADSINKVKESMTQMVEAGAKPMVDILGKIADVAASISSAFAGMLQTDFMQGIITAGTALAVGGKVFGMLNTAGAVATGSKTGAELVARMPMTARAMAWGRASGRSGNRPSNIQMFSRAATIGGLLTGSTPLVMAGIGGWMLGPGQSKGKDLALGALGFATGMFNDTMGSRRFKDIMGKESDSWMDAEINRKLKAGEDLDVLEQMRFDEVIAAGGLGAATASMFGATDAEIFEGRTTKRQTTRGGAGYNTAQRASARLQGFDVSDLGVIDYGLGMTGKGGMWTKEERDAFEQRQKDLWNETLKSGSTASMGRKARVMGGRGASIALQPLIGLGTMAGGAMGGVVNRIIKGITPGSLAVSGGLALAGGLAYGSQQQDAAKEAASTTEAFATAVGSSTAAMNDFSQSIANASQTTSTMASAMEVTSDEMKMVSSEEYVNALKEAMPEGTSAEQMAMVTAATMQYQPAELQEQWINALAGIFGEADAEAIANAALSGKYNPVEALGMYIENQKHMGLLGGGLNEEELLGNIRYSIARSDDVMKMATATGESLNAALTQISTVQGSTAALQTWQEQVAPALFQAAGTGAVGKEEMKQVLQTTLGLTTDQIDDFANEVDRQTKNIADAYGRGAITQEEAVAQVQELWTETAQSTKWWTGTTDTAGMEAQIEEAKAGTESFTAAMSSTSAAAAQFQGALEAASQAINPQTGQKGMTAQEALSADRAYWQAQKKSNAGVELTEEEQAALSGGSTMSNLQYQVLSAYENPEAASSQAFTQAMGQMGALWGTQNWDQWIGQQEAKIQEAQKQRLEGGELSPEEITMVTNQYAAMQSSLQGWTGSYLNSTQAREMSTELAQVAVETMKVVDEQGNISYQFSDNAQAAEMQSAALNTLGQNLSSATGKMREFGKGAINMEYQQSNMLEDFNRQAQYAYEDAALQQARATEDFQIQQMRAQEDFQIQQQRATDDYNKQVMRAEEDFNKQMLRAEEDYYRQVQYAEEDFQKQMTRMQEDFEKSMTRAAEDMAYGMMDPYQRIGSERVWSASGIIQNIEEQNNLIKEQLDALAELTARGLSEDAIKMLGLNDPKNAKQVVYLKDMTDAQIEELNRLAAERKALGEEMWEESTEYQRAYEDYMLAVQRATEDFNTQMARMNEEFLLQQQRAMEDFATQMARAEEDFQLQMTRMTEDFQRSMLHMEEDFERSMARMWEDVERNLNRQYDEMMIQIERMEEALVLSFTTVQATWRQMFDATRQYLEENQINYDDFNREIAEGAATTTEEMQTTTLEDMQKIMEGSMEDVTTAADESERELVRVGEHLSRIVDEETREIDRLTGEVESYTTTAIDEMDRMGTNAHDNIDKVFNELMDSITTTTTGLPEKIKGNMGEYAWILEWPSGQGGANGNEKFITIRVDEDSFDATFGSYTGGGMPGMPGGAPPISGASNDDLFVVNGQGSISQQYGNPSSGYAAGYHTGVDVSAAAGTPLYATISGKVTKSYYDSSYGNMVEIDDDVSGVNVMYAHMQSKGIAAGSRVTRGTNIGRVGSTGNSTGPHVHVEARTSPYKYGNDVNPLPYMADGGIATGTRHAIIGEAGPEAIIPLNRKGAELLGEMLKKYAMNDEVRALRTAGYSVQHTSYTNTTINDSSIHTGPMTVVSDNPDRVFESVQKKARQQRLGTRV